MSVKGDSADKWITTKIPRSLYHEMDKFVSRQQKYGVDEYESVPHFIRKACILLLETKQEKRKEREKEVTA
jgi:Arc/MetJ-type ribon-helix-helix transcriptional regulator